MINLLKNNDNKIQSDVEWMQNFFDFLQGKVPDGLYLRRGHVPKMSSKKALSVIYYLQEFLPILPDTIEQCWHCGRLFDTEKEGLYWESKQRFYCGSCMDHVPPDYDKGKR